MCSVSSLVGSAEVTEDKSQAWEGRVKLIGRPDFEVGLKIITIVVVVTVIFSLVSFKMSSLTNVTCDVCISEHIPIVLMLPVHPLQSPNIYGEKFSPKKKKLLEWNKLYLTPCFGLYVKVFLPLILFCIYLFIYSNCWFIKSAELQLNCSSQIQVILDEINSWRWWNTTGSVSL